MGISSGSFNTGKPVGAPKRAEGAGALRHDISTKPDVPIQETDLVTETRKKQEKTGKPLDKTTRRSMSQKDVSEQLVNMNRPVNQRNVEILARMIEYRLEVTPETFDMIENLTKKKQKANVIESTVVAHTKGLGDLKKSVDVLMRFFANQNKSGVNNELLAGQLNKVQALLGKGQELFDKGLLQGVLALIEDIRKDVRSRLKKTGGDKAFNIQLAQGEFLQNLGLFNQFLAGLEEKIMEKYSQSPVYIQDLKEQIGSLKTTVQRNVNDLTVQFVLSKESKYTLIGDHFFEYWQIPCPISKVSATLDICIKKDKSQRNKPINPENTTLILCFETERLGSVTIKIDVKGSFLNVSFYTDDGQIKKIITQSYKDIIKQLEGLNYRVKKIETIEKKFNIKRVLLPKSNLDDITRIVTEA